MLSNNHSFMKLNLLKKHKVEPMKGNVSLDDLAFLVKRLSVQVDDLVEENNQKKTSSPIDSVVTITPQPPTQIPTNQSKALLERQQQNLPALPPLPVQQSNNTHTRQNSIVQYIKPEHASPAKPASHTIVDPWASYVPQNYGALLQRLEDIESLQKCPNECCASTGTVASADGVPWPQPLEPFRNASSTEQQQDLLDVQYTHWCTLLRCLPLMDPVTSAHVKTVGLYAMREILKTKASQKRDHEPLSIITTKYTNNSYHPTDSTSTRLRESMSFLNSATIGGLATTAPTAIQDMPSWLTASETKTALDVEAGPTPLPKEHTLNESTTTPTPSSFPSPLFQHTGKRFQKWIQYKKMTRKSNTDTATTPLGQSQTLRKIGSWFF
ncbi:unnamed protein product [Mucor hiemalis]